MSLLYDNDYDYQVEKDTYYLVYDFHWFSSLLVSQDLEAFYYEDRNAFGAFLINKMDNYSSNTAIK